MYESPIEIVIGKITTELKQAEHDYIVRSVRDVGINVNEAELIKALQYDRNQYEKGFKDGNDMYELLLHWLAQAFGSPCGWTFNKQDIADFIGERDPEFCNKKCGCSAYECWKKYFELYKEFIDLKGGEDVLRNATKKKKTD